MFKKKSVTQFIIKSALVLNITSLPWAQSLAHQWPIFSPLSPINVEKLIIKENCPKGEGRIPFNSKVEIYNYYIPTDEKWYWHYQGEGKCVKLPANLHYVRFYQSGIGAGNFIETDYGEDPQDIAFRFIFPIKGLWECGALYPSNLPLKFGCAMDRGSE